MRALLARAWRDVESALEYDGYDVQELNDEFNLS